MTKIQFLVLAMLSLMYSVSAQSPTLQITPSQQTITPNQAVTYHVDVTNIGASGPQLFFSVLSTNLPQQNATLSFSPTVLNHPYTGGTDLSILVNGSIPLGVYTITIKASNGPVTTTASCTLEISANPCSWDSQLMPPGVGSYYLTIDKNGDKWIHSAGGALSRNNGTNWTHYTSGYPFNNNFNPDSRVYCDSNGLIFIYAPNNGIASFDGTFWTQYNTQTSAIPTDTIMALNIDKQGNKWIACKHIGLLKFDGTNWTTYPTTGTIVSNAFNNNRFMYLTIDNAGNVWVAGNDSASSITQPQLSLDFLAKFDGSTWTRYDVNNSSWGQFNCVATDLKTDKNGNIWFGVGMPMYCSSVNSAGLVKFDGSKWEIWHQSTLTPYNHYIYDNSGNVITQDNQSNLEIPFARELLLDDKQQIWIAHHDALAGVGNGVTKFHIPTGFCERFTPVTSNIPQIAVTGLGYYKGTIWVTVTNDFYNWSSNVDYLAKYQCSAHGVGIDNEVFTQVSVFPNPFSNQTTFALTKPIHKGELTLFDSNGKSVVHLNNLEGTEIILQRDNLPAGLYFYCIKTPNQLFATGKLIIE